MSVYHDTSGNDDFHDHDDNNDDEEKIMKLLCNIFPTFLPSF